MSMNRETPLCWKCGLELRPEKNGVVVVEMATFGPGALWQADLWKCPECGTQVIAGLARDPMTEHYKPDFADELRRAEASGWSKRV